MTQKEWKERTTLVNQKEWDAKTTYKGGVVHAKFLRLNDSTWVSPYSKKIVVQRGKDYVVIGLDTCNFLPKLKN